MLGIFHKRVTSEGALAAIVIGFCFYGYFGLMRKIPDSDFCDFFGARLHWLHIAGINFVLLSVVMCVLAAVRPRPEPYEQSYTEEVDITPWRGALPCGIGILVLIALMYALMSRFGA